MSIKPDFYFTFKGIQGSVTGDFVQWNGAGFQLDAIKSVQMIEAIEAARKESTK